MCRKHEKVRTTRVHNDLVTKTNASQNSLLRKLVKTNLKKDVVDTKFAIL
jgi:hypothetical protein